MSTRDDGQPIKPLPRTRPRSNTFVFPNIQGWSGIDEGNNEEEVSNPMPQKKKVVVPRECIILDTVDLEAISAIEPPATAILSPRTIASVPPNGRLEAHLHYHRYATVKNIINRIERAHPGGGEGIPPKVEGNTVMATAIEELVVALGTENHTRHPVAHFTFLDTRFFLKTEIMIDVAKSIVWLFEHNGVPKRDVCVCVVKIPASEQGILAAKVLEAAEGEDKIYTNLTEVSCLEHALACVQAGASCITMNVGEIVKWFDLQFAPKDQDGINLGIVSIRNTVRYFHEKKIATKIFGSGFRSIEEVELLVGYLDALFISQELLEDIHISSSSPRPPIPSLSINFPPMNVNLEDLLQSFSAFARSIFTGTINISLNAERKCMQAIQRGISREMGQQNDTRSMGSREWLEVYEANREKEDEAWEKHRSPVGRVEGHVTGGREGTPEPEERRHERDRKETRTVEGIISGLIADDGSKAESSDTIECF